MGTCVNAVSGFSFPNGCIYRAMAHFNTEKCVEICADVRLRLNGLTLHASNNFEASDAGYMKSFVIVGLARFRTGTKR